MEKFHVRLIILLGVYITDYIRRLIIPFLSHRSISHKNKRFYLALQNLKPRIQSVRLRPISYLNNIHRYLLLAMHLTSISTIPLALALLLTSSSLLCVSAAPDSVAIVEPSENNQAQFDDALLRGPTLPENEAPGFTSRRYKARGRAITAANNIVVTNTAVAGRDLAHRDPNDIDGLGTSVGRGTTIQDMEAFDAYAKTMCPVEPNLCKPN